MPFTPLVTAGIETALNAFLWRDKALKPARQRLLGKVLQVQLQDFATPVVLVFSERQVDVLSAWDGEADCTVITRLSVLPKLRNRQQLTALIRSGELEVQGDLQVVQNLVSLCDLAEFDPAELLAPYTGDIVAEGVGKVLRGGAQFLLKGAQRQQRYVAEAITEEWRLAPGGAWSWPGLLKRQRLLNARWPHWKTAGNAGGQMTPGELRRLYFIIHTFLSYGLDELIPKMRITLPLRIWRRMLFWMPNRHQDQPLGARLRLALQELGPVWIKFGQMLSTRRDLFPPQIADQLALLQDRVAPFEGKLAQQQIEKAMGGLPVEAWFDDFSVEPLASASIAQVHTARLKENGKEVVIKVIRPDILPIIKADMKLIYRLARWVPRLLPDGRRLRPQEVVREYEKRCWTS